MKKFLALILAACMLLSLSAAALAEDNYTELDTNPEGTTIDNNYNFIINNYGVVTNNRPEDTGGNMGNITYNYGTVENNMSASEDGCLDARITNNNNLIDTNNGAVSANNAGGTITTNNGTVETNNDGGTIETNSTNAAIGVSVNSDSGNFGTVGTADHRSGTGNSGTITINQSTGTVYDNNADGTIGENLGTVVNNNAGGTVTDNGTTGTVITNNAGATIGDINDSTTGNYGEVGTSDHTEGTGNFGTITVNQENATVYDNNAGGTIGENIGTVVNNNDKGTVTDNASTGTVITNNAGATIGNIDNSETGNWGEVGTEEHRAGTGNSGTITINQESGTVYDNNKGGLIEANEGTVVNNTGDIGRNNGEVKNNTGYIEINNEKVENNSGTIEYNVGTVVDNLLNGIVTFGEVKEGETNEGVVETNYGTVNNADVNDEGQVIAGNNTVFGVTYDDGTKESEPVNASVAKGTTLIVADGEAAGTRDGYTFGGWSVDTTAEGIYLSTYYGGEQITIEAPIWFSAIWNLIQSGEPVSVEAQPAGNGYTFSYKADDSGVEGTSTGNSFLIKRDKASLMLINFGEYYLVEGEDYEIVETEEGIVINFLPAFFEKYERNIFDVSLLFNGSVCYTLKVTRPEA